MKRFLITSPKFSGEAELIYDAGGILKKIDCSNTDMAANIMHHFKTACPVNVESLAASFKEPTVIIESDIVIHFNEFWLKYNHKFNKERCEKLWERLSKSDQIIAFYELDKYHKYLRKNNTQIKMHPDTYLRNKAWQNDYK